MAQTVKIFQSQAELLASLADAEKNFPATSVASLPQFSKHEATVVKAIEPLKTGQIRFQGSWWSARCQQDITLQPGEIVRVVGRQNITLLVEPLNSTPAGRVSRHKPNTKALKNSEKPMEVPQQPVEASTALSKLVKSYLELSNLPELSQADEKRMQAILELAQYDDELHDWINKVDQLVTNQNGIIAQRA